MSDHYDFFVIGAGSGGVRSSRLAASTGAKVAIAEELRVGGTCVLRGCVPKKLLVIGSHFADDFEDARAYGWDLGGEPTLDEILPGSPVWDPANQAVSTEELRSLVTCLSTVLSELESRVLSLYLDGHSYVDVGELLGCDCKTVDNALQRVKRKVGAHLAEREVLL